MVLGGVYLGFSGGVSKCVLFLDPHIGDNHFLVVSHTGNCGLALRHNVVIVNVVGQQALGYSGS